MEALNLEGKRVPLLDPTGVTVVVVYPGKPSDMDMADWQSVPRACGCTAQACAVRDELKNLPALVVLLSNQPIADQKAWSDQHKLEELGLVVLNDPDLGLKDKLELQTMQVGGREVYERQILVFNNGVKVVSSGPMHHTNGTIEFINRELKRLRM